jgi:hypothetical protein
MITITYDNKQKQSENFYEIRNNSKPSQRQIYDNNLDYLSPQVRKNYS